MSTLDVMCAICSEFYKTTDKIYTTHCGHLFHHNCLTRWFKRSQTCPECRICCYNERPHRVFLNYGERTAADDELNANFEQEDPYWEYIDLPLTTQNLPEDVVKSGMDADGNDVYVARAPYQEDLLPANFVPALGGVYAPWGFKAHFLSEDIELLCSKNYKWVSACNGEVPDNAMQVGYTGLGEILYTARAVYEGILLPGKLHRSYGLMYMPYRDKEIYTTEYEVLVQWPKEQQI